MKPQYPINIGEPVVYKTYLLCHLPGLKSPGLSNTAGSLWAIYVRNTIA